MWEAKYIKKLIPHGLAIGVSFCLSRRKKANNKDDISPVLKVREKLGWKY